MLLILTPMPEKNRTPKFEKRAKLSKFEQKYTRKFEKNIP